MMKSKESLMKSNSLTATEENLVRKLFGVWKDKEFVLGIIGHLSSDEERQAVIDLIDNNKGIKPEQLTALAINISNGEDFVVDDFYSWMKEIEVDK